MTLSESSAETLVAFAPMAEPPAEENWLTGAADADGAGATLDSKDESKSVGRAFLALRVASFVLVLCSFGILVTLESSQGGWIVWVGTGGLLAYLAFAAEVLLRWMHRRVETERMRSTEMFLERQGESPEIAPPGAPPHHRNFPGFSAGRLEGQ